MQLVVGYSGVTTVEGAEADTIAQLPLYQDVSSQAFMNNRGRRSSLPICGSTTSREPGAGAFTKPVLLPVDEMSASAAGILRIDHHIACLSDYGNVA